MDAAPDIERFPLPEGQPDVTLNKAQLAEAMCVSETTIDKWIRKAGFPILEGGSNGVAYQFRLSHVWAWRQEWREGERAKTEEAQRAVQQMRMTLLGLDDDDESREALLSPKERTEELRAESAFLVAARQRRELVPTPQVIELLEGIFGIVRDGLEAHPDRAARLLGLDGQDTEKLVALNDEMLGQLRAMIEMQYLGTVPDRLA